VTYGLTTLAIDVGGTGIKAIVLDQAGSPITERQRLLTPRPAVPEAVLQVIEQLAQQCGAFDRVSVGFPGVVRHGVTETAPNLHPSWHGVELAERLTQRLQRPTRVANDADVQGFGAIQGEGLEMVITLGTGVGSALFVDGILVPNLELAHHPFSEGKTYEQWLGDSPLKQLGQAAWVAKLHEACDLMRRIFNFDVLYLGGGNARLLESEALPKDVKLVQNIAGLLGGIALWTGLHGTGLVRAPQAIGAHSVISLATPSSLATLPTVP
jgi:polyphosphate glucokinase